MQEEEIKKALGIIKAIDSLDGAMVEAKKSERLKTIAEFEHLLDETHVSYPFSLTNKDRDVADQAVRDFKRSLYLGIERLKSKK